MPRRLLTLLTLAVLLGGSPAGPAAARAESRAAPRVEAQRPGIVDVYVLSFGLWGPQSVFESEAKGAARVLAERLDADGRTIVRFNGKRRFGALPRDLVASAEAVGRAIDPDEDVAVMVLTSHGSPEGVGIVAGRTRRLLSPDAARGLLDRTRARYRVLVVSACYSGVFAEALADPRTLVIAAAAPDRPSFGCRDGATWTYFGDAFFNRALRTEPSLAAAFARAREFVTRRESREGFDPSEPQMAGGADVLAKLDERARRTLEAGSDRARGDRCLAALAGRAAACSLPSAAGPR